MNASLEEDDRRYDAMNRDEPEDPRPIQFTREELIEIDAANEPEIAYINAILADMDAQQVKPAHLLERLRLLKSIRGKIEEEIGGEE